MKKFQYLIGISLALFSLNGCATKPLDTQNYQRKWMLVELQGFNKENLVKACQMVFKSAPRMVCKSAPVSSPIFKAI